MKNILRFTLLASIFITINAHASIGIKSIELNDSTIISGADITAITLKNSDSSIHSFETVNGDLINHSEIKSINLFRIKEGNQDSSGDKLGGLGRAGFNLMSVSRSGGDSGG